MSREAEMPVTACPQPLGQWQETARFSCHCSLCSSFCFWGILLTVAVTISDQEKYRNLETIQGKLGSWYFTYSCYWNRLRTISKVHFSPCLEIHSRSTFHVVGGVVDNLKCQPLQFSQIAWTISFSLPLGHRSNLLRKSKYLPTRLFPKNDQLPEFYQSQLERKNILKNSLNNISFIYPCRLVLSNRTFCDDRNSQYLCWPI